QCLVFAGAVVLTEDPTKDQRDPHNWSDVLVFYVPGYIPDPGTYAAYATFVSDHEDAAGNSTGITDADFAAAGLGFPVSLVATSATTVFLPENPVAPENPYAATSPDGRIAHYVLVSDPPEHPVAAEPSTWGRIKGLYHYPASQQDPTSCQQAGRRIVAPLATGTKARRHAAFS